MDASTIPDDLVRDLAGNNVVLFMGHIPGQHRSGELRAPTEAELVKELGNTGQHSGSNGTFAQVAQSFEQQRGRQRLIQTISDQLDQPEFGPSPVHRWAARIPFRAYLTSALHLHLEQAFVQAQQPFTKVVTGSQLSFSSFASPALVKLYGDIDNRDHLYLTTRDRWRRLDQRAFVDAVRGWLGEHRLLLIAPDLQDGILPQLLGSVFDAQGVWNRRAYAVVPGPAPPGSAIWGAHEIDIIDADPTLFLQGLSERLRSIRASQVVAPPSPRRPARPYKFLDYYDEGDRAIFFGRDAEIAQATSQIQVNRLYVLTGESGAGKSSLLLAGILPRLRKEGFIALPIRLMDDPLANLKRSLSDMGRGGSVTLSIGAAPPSDEAEAALTTPLAKQIRTLQQRVGAPLALALDQFEEFFTRFPLQAQQRFIAELSEALSRRDIRLHVVLALREDYFARLHAFRARIPQVYDHTMHLPRLEQRQAEEAINGPLDLFPARFDPDLVQLILEDLSQDEEIQPPHLQIVCDRIYQRLLDSNAREATPELYEEMGRAPRILSQYLEDVLLGLPEPQRETSREVLKALVTSERTKDLLTAQQIAGLASLDAQPAQESLAHLVDLRLLRPVAPDGAEGPGAIQYELAHDRLAEQVGAWVSEPERQARKAKEILRRELISWQDHEALLHAEELQVIGEQRLNRELQIDAQEAELLLLSAVQLGLQVGAWIDRLQDETDVVAVLQVSLEEKDPRVRARAAQWLGQVGGARAADALLARTLEDPDASVRKRAAEALIRVDGAAADRLAQHLGQDEQRKPAAAALWDQRHDLALQSGTWMRAGAITTLDRLGNKMRQSPDFVRRRLLPVAGIVVLAIVLAVLGIMRLDRTPQQAIVDDPNTTVVLRNRFKIPFERIELTSDIVKAELVDVDGDGRDDVLLGTGGTGQEPGQIAAYNARGDLLWRFDTYEDRYETGHGKFVVIDFRVEELYGTGEKQIVFTARDEAWYPSRLSVLDLAGNHLGTYWHPGFVNHFVAADFDGDGDKEILACADNNNLRQVIAASEPGANFQAVFLLDSRNLDGQAFPPAIEGLRSGHELWYAFLHPTEFSFSDVMALDVDGDGILNPTFVIGKGWYHYTNYEGELVRTRMSDAFFHDYPDGAPEMDIVLIRRDETGEWGLAPMPEKARQ